MSDDLANWVRIAQALVVPAVTVAGILIAWGQLSLAKRRMQLDLYDRRYKIFHGARTLIANILREGRVDLEQIFAYRRETGDAVFLLDRGTEAFLQELEKQALRLRHVAVIVATDRHPGRDAAVDEEAELLGWFTDQFEVLVEKFRPTLQLRFRRLPWLTGTTILKR